MGLKRQAKILTKGQTEAVLAYLTSTRYPERNRAIFLLSVQGGAARQGNRVLDLGDADRRRGKHRRRDSSGG